MLLNVLGCAHYTDAFNESDCAKQNAILKRSVKKGDIEKCLSFCVESFP